MDLDETCNIIEEQWCALRQKFG